MAEPLSESERIDRSSPQGASAVGMRGSAVRQAIVWYRGLPDLGSVLRSRENNFDLARLIAAASVLWGHAAFFSPDRPELPDPSDWISRGRESAASVAVYSFFLISGLLISASMERHRGALAFVLARVARLWPGFLVCTAVMVYLVAPAVSHVPLLDRHHLREAGACLRQNAVFPVFGDCEMMSGAFPQSVIKEYFGFPFWTLVVEVHCYAMVLILGVALRGRLTSTPRRALAYLMGTSLFVLVVAWLHLYPDGVPQVMIQSVLTPGGYSVLPAWFFLAGMALYAVRDHVKVSALLGFALAVAALLPGSPWVLGYAALGYGLLVFGAWKPLRRLRPRRDLSYGIYIYGTGMQQVAYALLGTVAPLLHFAVAAVLTSACALVSHVAVEAPAIRAGHRAIARLDRGR